MTIKKHQVGAIHSVFMDVLLYIRCSWMYCYTFGVHGCIKRTVSEFSEFEVHNCKKNVSMRTYVCNTNDRIRNYSAH